MFYGVLLFVSLTNFALLFWGILAQKRDEDKDRAEAWAALGKAPKT